MNTEKLLERWVEARLLDREQADRILKYEREHASGSWVLYGLSGLGVVVLLTGLVSIIAANWDYISSTTKLIAYFLSLAALAWAAFYLRDSRGPLRETLLTGFGLYVLAGIGLIGQTYHLESDGYSALFFWLIITLPTTLSTHSRLLNHLWFLVLAVAVSLWTVAHPERAEEKLFVVVALPYLFLGIGYGLHTLLSQHFAATARFWAYATILLPFAIMGNFGWVSGVGEVKDFLEKGEPLIAIAGVIAALLAVLTQHAQLGKVLTAAVCFTIVVSAILTITPLVREIGRHDLIGCLLFILVWSGAAAVAAASGRKRLFDFAAFVIGVRFVVVYFEVFGSLAATGIGLIISGLVILGVAYVWHRYRRKLELAIQSAMQGVNRGTA